ncbi:unnamed protein product, partial [Sphacelaria rigidula]
IYNSHFLNVILYIRGVNVPLPHTSTSIQVTLKSIPHQSQKVIVFTTFFQHALTRRESLHSSQLPRTSRAKNDPFSKQSSYIYTQRLLKTPHPGVYQSYSL